jgi:hypothetical protein
MLLLPAQGEISKYEVYPEKRSQISIPIAEWILHTFIFSETKLHIFMDS